MRLTAIALAAAIPSAALAAAASLQPFPTVGSTEVVAKIGGADLTAGQIDLMTDLSAGRGPAAATTPSETSRRLSFHRLAEIRALAAHAEAEGFSARPEVKFRQALTHDGVLAEAYLSSIVVGKIDDPALHGAYDSYVQAVSKDQDVKFSQVVAGDAKAVDEIAAEVGKAEPAARMEAFRKSAEAHGIKVLDVPYTAESKMLPDLRKPISETAAGSVFGPLSAVKRTFYGIVVERRPTKPDSYESMKPKLVQALTQKIRSEAIAKAVGEVGVEIVDHAMLDEQPRKEPATPVRN